MVLLHFVIQPPREDMQRQDPILPQAILHIVVNGEELESCSATLAALVRELDLAEARVATALNQCFIPRAKRHETPLADGDRVEIVSPRQGG